MEDNMDKNEVKTESPIYWTLTIDRREIFDVINALEKSFLEQMYNEGDFIRYACSELERQGYLVSTDIKPRRSHFFWDTNKYSLVDRFIVSERPDLLGGDSEVSFKCAGNHVGCKPDFDYSSGEYMDDEEKNRELMLNLKKF